MKLACNFLSWCLYLVISGEAITGSYPKCGPSHDALPILVLDSRHLTWRGRILHSLCVLLNRYTRGSPCVCK